MKMASPHPMCSNPTEFWKLRLEEGATVMRFKVKPPKDPPKEGKVRATSSCVVQDGFHKVRVVCMSDTHSLHSHLRRSVPAGDIFIHAGDFTRCGHIDEVKNASLLLV